MYNLNEEIHFFILILVYKNKHEYRLTQPLKRTAHFHIYPVEVPILMHDMTSITVSDISTEMLLLWNEHFIFKMIQGKFFITVFWMS
jgi:hypothetical protein